MCSKKIYNPPKLMILQPLRIFNEYGCILAYIESSTEYKNYINFRISKIEDGSPYIHINEKTKMYFDPVYCRNVLPFLDKEIHSDLLEINKLPDTDVKLYYELNGLNIGGKI